MEGYFRFGVAVAILAFANFLAAEADGEAEASTCSVVFWEHCGEPESGWPEFGEGEFTSDDLRANGVRLNSISGLTISGPEDCQVILYDEDRFQGWNTAFFKHDFPDGQCKNFGEPFTDTAESVRVKRFNEEEKCAYKPVHNKGCSSYIHMDDEGKYGVKGGQTTLEQCSAAVRRLNGKEGCRGEYFFYETHGGGYCNCPTDGCNDESANKNAGGEGQLYEQAGTCNENYWVGDRRMKYHAAKEYCKQHGGSLAIIETPDAQVKAAKACGKFTCWLGLEEGSSKTDEWYWLKPDGSRYSNPIRYVNFEDGEPNNHEGNDEKFGMMNCCGETAGKPGGGATGKWHDTDEHYDQPRPLCMGGRKSGSAVIAIILSAVFVLLCVVCGIVRWHWRRRRAVKTPNAPTVQAPNMVQPAVQMVPQSAPLPSVYRNTQQPLIQQPQASMSVQIPPGCQPGSILAVQTPQGNHVQFTVPAGASAGQMIQVAMPRPMLQAVAVPVMGAPMPMMGAPVPMMGAQPIRHMAPMPAMGGGVVTTPHVPTPPMGASAPIIATAVPMQQGPAQVVAQTKRSTAAV